jgi:hypothetical protein
VSVGVWLIAAGVTLYEVGVLRQLVGDWRRHGFTHFRHGTLWCLLLGRCCVAAGAVLLSMPALAVVAGVPAILTVAVMGLKLRDRWRCRR